MGAPPEGTRPEARAGAFAAEAEGSPKGTLAGIGVVEGWYVNYSREASCNAPWSPDGPATPVTSISFQDMKSPSPSASASSCDCCFCPAASATTVFLAQGLYMH